MKKGKMIKIWKDNESEYLKFERIPIDQRRSSRPDINAFILLNELVPGNRDMVSAADHDEIWLDVELDDLVEVIEEYHIIDLLRCGVMLDHYEDCLHMFA